MKIHLVIKFLQLQLKCRPAEYVNKVDVCSKMSLIFIIYFCLFVSLLVCLTVRSHLSKTTVQISLNFLCMLPMAMAWSSSDGNAICHVLPVVWMTSCFYIMDKIGQNQRRHVCFVQFARWRHRGKVCRFRLHLV